MILGNLGKLDKGGTIQSRPFPYVIREKMTEFPVFSLHIREFVPTLRVLFLLS